MTTEGHCLSSVMAGLVPAIHVFPDARPQDVDARVIGVRKHAVLRTAMPAHDDRETERMCAQSSFRGASAASEPGIQMHARCRVLDSGSAAISAFTRVFDALWAA